MDQVIFETSNIPTLVFTALALLVAAVAAFEDAKTGKIRNKLIVGGFTATVAFHVFFIFVFVFLSRGSNARFDPGYLLDLLLNTVVAFVCAVVMWKLGAWSAGDSKLFAVLAFILPLDYYARGYVPVFPSSALLINIFLVSFLIVTVRFFIGILSLASEAAAARAWEKLNLKERIENASRSIGENIHGFFIMFVIFNIVHHVLRYLRSFTSPGGGSILAGLIFMAVIYGVMPALSGPIKKSLKKLPSLKYLLPLLVAAFLATLFIKYSLLFGRVAEAGKTTAGFMVIVALIRRLVETYFENIDVYKTFTDKVKAGMVPTPETMKILEDEAGLDDFFMDGLTKEQVAAVREHIPGDRELTFVTTIPFAPLALAGLVATIIMKMSVLHFIFMKMGR